MLNTIAIILGLSIGGANVAVDESKEPPLKYMLEINGKTHEVTLGQPLQLQGTFKNPKVVLNAASTRLFNYSGVQFQYPASFTWEADIEENAEKNWTVSGIDFSIMYFALSEPSSVQIYAEVMAITFGKEKTRISNVERTFGGRQYKGKLIVFNFSKDIILNTEIYALPTKKGTRFIVFQDSPPENKAISKDCKKTMALFSKTFKDMNATTGNKK